METKSGKAAYIENLREGDLIAFKLYSNDAKMYSGKVTKIGLTTIEAQTKNGKKYFIEKSNIEWVNSNGRWPKHVMTAFKGVDYVHRENEQISDAIENESEWEVDNGSSEAAAE